MSFENVAFALQYNYFDLDVKLNDPAWLGGLKCEYHGPVLSVAVFSDFVLRVERTAQPARVRAGCLIDNLLMGYE